MAAITKLMIVLFYLNKIKMLQEKQTNGNELFNAFKYIKILCINTKTSQI